MRYQYQITGLSHFHSQSGNAILALTNNQGSGKKFIVERLDVEPIYGVSAANVTNRLRIIRDWAWSEAYSDAPFVERITPTPLDTNAPDWEGSSTIPSVYIGEFPNQVFQSGAFDRRTFTTIPMATPLVASTALASLATMNSIGKYRGFTRGASPSTESPTVYDSSDDTEASGISVLAQGTSVTASPGGVSQVLLLNAVIRWYDSVSNTTSRWAVTKEVTITSASDSAFFRLVFQGPGGTTSRLTLEEFSLLPFGSTDTPYLQLVPISQIRENYVGDPVRKLTPIKLDSDSPDFTFGQFWADVGVASVTGLENYIAEGAPTGAAPKGFSYLQTKDFSGPVLRTTFPEISLKTWGNTALPITGSNMNDLNVAQAGITVRPGGGVALCGAAETAAGSTVVGTAGLAPYLYTMLITVEPEKEPTLTLTGLKNPSEVRVYPAGSQTPIAGQEDVTGGTYSTTLDPDVVTAIDISILSLGYQNMRLLNIPIGTTDVTIPVSQVLDRQYANP